eukprot:CAMPEP_0185583644 /NCGR_PEP_ID=MMETSP0434-20130131/26502_1 /TAXON_ID=626734 ORGANISM="Favella taraikaensis, Strain Fe Narragansett Bay" /NCGR_SAMPLE_ID=MMETSP0434 /ASSEMBLY_ACC=CAM_ASM_000379 /LENGTH=170 /DNA_ID=CAMNT_0028202893 /DNA_START=3517 /DNA_END=4029 /DNA_ORIENTATION=+
MAAQLDVFLRLDVFDHLVEVKLAHLIHAGVDLDYIALVTRFFHRHFHHIGSFLLNPLVFIGVILTRALTGRIEALFLVFEALGGVPCASLAWAPLCLMLQLADPLRLLISLLSASVGIDRFDCLDGGHGEVVREEVSVERGAHEDELEAQSFLLALAQQMFDDNEGEIDV